MAKRTVEERIEALKKAGVDVSQYFSVKGANGGEQMMRLENGIMKTVDEIDDARIIAEIIAGGYTNERQYRRWVLAQMCYMLHENTYSHGYWDSLRKKGYEYQWKLLAHKDGKKIKGELHRLHKAKVSGNVEELKVLEKFFNKDVVTEMFKDYFVKLRAYIDGLPVKYYGGVYPYKHITGLRQADKDIFLIDIERKHVRTLEKDYMTRVRFAGSYEQLAKVVYDFQKEMIRIPWLTEMADAFKQAYVGAGAYYSMENLIKFHDCKFVCIGGMKSWDYVNERLNNMKPNEYYKLLGMLKELMKVNQFDFGEKVRTDWGRRSPYSRF